MSWNSYVLPAGMNPCVGISGMIPERERFCQLCACSPASRSNGGVSPELDLRHVPSRRRARDSGQMRFNKPFARASPGRAGVKPSIKEKETASPHQRSDELVSQDCFCTRQGYGSRVYVMRLFGLKICNATGTTCPQPPLNASIESTVRRPEPERRIPIQIRIVFEGGRRRRV